MFRAPTQPHDAAHVHTTHQVALTAFPLIRHQAALVSGTCEAHRTAPRSTADVVSQITAIALISNVQTTSAVLQEMMEQVDAIEDLVFPGAVDLTLLGQGSSIHSGSRQRLQQA